MVICAKVVRLETRQKNKTFRPECGGEVGQNVWFWLVEGRQTGRGDGGRGGRKRRRGLLTAHALVVRARGGRHALVVL